MVAPYRVVLEEVHQEEGVRLHFPAAVGEEAPYSIYHEVEEVAEVPQRLLVVAVVAKVEECFVALNWVVYPRRCRSIHQVGLEEVVVLHIHTQHLEQVEEELH